MGKSKQWGKYQYLNFIYLQKYYFYLLSNVLSYNLNSKIFYLKVDIFLYISKTREYTLISEKKIEKLDFMNFFLGFLK